MTTKRDDVSIEQAPTAQKARILRLMAKRTLCLLNPDDAARDAAVAKFDAVLDREMGRC
jgi:hypothetical protein